ncbi:NADPH-dependent F420 reductase [Bordetella sp. FB-8]|uniref:NADPH-dependent F420 reductase n=1 Tax=Bordetella sp. FB-8 TaxID=1159870 RepID=UPI00037F9CC5|nr:NAD(P)-binding domain-containing protein [Bordetella sp. FB-8]
MSFISIIGSGGMAAAIGGLAAKAGHTVEVMSRDAAKAQALAEQLGAGATTGTFGVAPAGDIVILAVPYAAVLDMVKQYGEALAGKLLIDITNPVGSDLKSFVTPEDSFGAREIMNAAPSDAVVVKAFNTLFSHVLAAGPVDGSPLDVFIAGDDAQAKARVSAFIESLGLRPMDTGQLSMALPLEHACLLSLGLLAHCVKQTNFSIGVNLLG